MLKSEKIVSVILIIVIMGATVWGSFMLNGFYLSYATGHSMEPTWKYFNIIWGHKPSSSSEIQVGNIVSFHFDNRCFVHRVTDILQDSEGKPLFFSWGDNREYCVCGESFSFEDIIFVVDGQIGVW